MADPEMIALHAIRPPHLPRNLMNITYYGDGAGNWIARTWAPQCGHPLLLGEPCQGAVGHAGRHWSYSPSGSYCWARNRQDPTSGGNAGGITPPGHPDWISPQDKQADHYRNHVTDTPVTDPTLIARLNRGELQDGEAIDQPIRVEDEPPELQEKLRKVLAELPAIS